MSEYNEVGDDVLWQTAPKKQVYKKVFDLVNLLDQRSSARHEAWRKYEYSYGGPYWNNTEPNMVDQINLAEAPPAIRINRCRLHVETYVSRWMKSRVLPMVVVKGGDFTLKEKAKKFNRLIEGAFEQLGVFDLDPKWCRDATKYGAGIAYVGEDGENPVIMRCDPFSIYIDDLEWVEGKGKTIHWVRLRSRNELKAEFPDHAEEIDQSASDDYAHLSRNMHVSTAHHVVPVVYSWSLGVGDPEDGGYEGRHTVCIKKCDLVDEVFDDDELPFAFMTRTAPEEGIWGEPLMADLAPVQETLDRYLKRIDESMWLVNVCRMIVRKGSKLDKQKLVPLPATILEVENMDDIQHHNAEISPQLMQFVNFTLQQMQELGRSNIMASTGDMPKGIRSYSAQKLLEETDMEGLREGLRSRDTFFVRIGRLLIKAFERLGGFKLLVASGKKAEQLNYKKLRLPKDCYQWTVMPTNFLAKTAEGRMDQAEWLVDQGLLPKDRVAHFIDFPDLESETAMAQAQNDAIMFRIEKIMEEDVYITPSPFLNLNLLRHIVGNAIARAEADEAPEEKIELLRQLVVDASTIQQAAAAPAPQQPVMTQAPIGAQQPPTPALTKEPKAPKNEQQPPPAQGI